MYVQVWHDHTAHVACIATGILAFLLSTPGHPLVQVSADARQRFHNCEMRSMVLQKIEPPPSPQQHLDSETPAAGAGGAHETESDTYFSLHLLDV